MWVGLSCLPLFAQTFGETGGLQTYTAPTTGTYHIVVKGASGGNTGYGTGGSGAILSFDVNLNAGDTLDIYVGQQGDSAAGGGGTFVVLNGTTLLAVAGGGGGAAGVPDYANPSDAKGGNAQLGTSGGTPVGGGAGGTAGSGGMGVSGAPPCSNNGSGGGGGGGGYLGNGTCGDGTGSGGQGFTTGSPMLAGGSGGGGYGGGGAGGGDSLAGGGGGGYSGGGGGGISFTNYDYFGGGGGGSYVNPSISGPSESVGNTGDGSVIITAPPKVLPLNFFGSGVEDAFQVTYVSQLNNADTVINISNAGTVAGTTPLTGVGVAAGDLCVNIYVYTPDQQQVACCSCRVTHNEIIYQNLGGPTESAGNSWGVPTQYGGSGIAGLLWNTTYGPGLYPFNSAVVKLVATNPSRTVACNNTTFNAATSTPGDITAANIAPADLAPGMAVWSTHPHPTNGDSSGTNANGQIMLPVHIAETDAQSKGLSLGELTGLTTLCTNIQNNSSGRGQCSCPTENLAGGFIAH